MSKTVYDCLEEDIIWHYGQINKLRTARRNLKGAVPQVLDMECRSAAVVSSDYVSLYADNGSPLVVDIFNLTDEDRMDVIQTKYGTRFVFFKFGDLQVQVNRRSPQKPCRSYRITKIVDICGEIDESKFESVEEVHKQIF